MIFYVPTVRQAEKEKGNQTQGLYEWGPNLIGPLLVPAFLQGHLDIPALESEVDRTPQKKRNGLDLLRTGDCQHFAGYQVIH